MIDPCERSVFQLLEQYEEDSNNNPLVDHATAKAHATITKKIFEIVFRTFSICN